jgi:serine/threonine protein phosphatase PrpC
MKYQLGKTSRLGNRVVNEDRLGVAETKDALLLVLADGMGGYRGGQIAAKTVVNRMLAQFKRSALPATDPKGFLKDLVSDAHLAVLHAGNAQYPPIEPRSTCVVCLIQDGCAWVAHVGDSRLYLYRQGEFIHRTTDHSKLEEMRRKGRLNVDEVEHHPQRNLVTRCIGCQELPPIATISEALPLEKYDLLLLCSDGLWNPLDEQKLVQNLAGQTLAQAVDRLAYQAEFRSYPEADNISLIMLRWISSESADDVLDEPEPDELTQTLQALDQAMVKLQKN